MEIIASHRYHSLKMTLVATLPASAIIHKTDRDIKKCSPGSDHQDQYSVSNSDNRRSYIGRMHETGHFLRSISFTSIHNYHVRGVRGYMSAQCF